MRSGTLLGICVIIALSGCSWAVKVTTHGRSSDGAGHYGYTGHTYAAGSVAHMAIGASCQADSSCRSGYCLDGYCVPDIVDAHEHHEGVSTREFGPLNPGCVHDVFGRTGYAVNKYGTRTRLLSGSSNCPKKYPFIEVRASSYARPDSLASCRFKGLPSGTQVFDCAPYGNPYNTDGMNDVVIPADEHDRAAGIPYTGYGPQSVFRGVRVGDDLWMDGPAETPGRGGRAYGPPYGPDRGDYLIPDYY